MVTATLYDALFEIAQSTLDRMGSSVEEHAVIQAIGTCLNTGKVPSADVATRAAAQCMVQTQVSITPHGSKFHNASGNCRYTQHGYTITGVRDARSKGLTICSNCDALGMETQQLLNTANDYSLKTTQASMKKPKSSHGAFVGCPRGKFIECPRLTSLAPPALEATKKQEARHKH
jgi:hypothetical protein